VIKLRPLIPEITKRQKELKKDYLFQQTKLKSANTPPPWDSMWAVMKDSDGMRNELEFYKDDAERRDEKFFEEEALGKLELEQKDRYFDLIEEYKNLDDEYCWRQITLPKGIDPLSISQLGVYWAIEENVAEAHWGKYSKGYYKATYKGIIDLHNVDWGGTLFARMDLSIGEAEKEIRFIKNARILVENVHTYKNGEVQRTIINNYRRV
jgi:hypothetical protein